MNAILISETLGTLVVGQDFTFPPNSSREFVRSFLWQPSNKAKRWKIETISLVKLSPSDKPMRITTVTRLT